MIYYLISDVSIKYAKYRLINHQTSWYFRTFAEYAYAYIVNNTLLLHCRSAEVSWFYRNIYYGTICDHYIEEMAGLLSLYST